MDDPAGSPSERSFRCHSCGRWYRWRADIAGRSLRCRCGEKVRCPAALDETATAEASLDDTVADVELEEALDRIEVGADAPDASLEQAADTEALFAARRQRRGLFGMTLGGEVLFYAAMSLIGVACAILAVILGKYFWWWIAAAVVTGPLSWWRLWKRWRTWSAGRSFMVALADVFGLHDERPAP
ncbi:MAG: hypothetical protein D6693_03605 [Planctomycetota bacterium]|nr:MAG: hypothetical protein D6693_03605 [Planctomycetota bacterium]